MPRRNYLKLRALMAEHNLKQEDMAKKLKMAISTFNRKLNGQVPWYYHECAKIAIMFGRSVEEIFPAEKEAVGR